MPASSPTISAADREHLTRLGERLRQARKNQKVSAVTASQAAGLSRVTLHRIERGEPSVTMGAWVAAAHAQGLTLDLIGGSSGDASSALPSRIRLGDYPQLKQLAWQLPGVHELSPREALGVYERNWRHVDRKALT